MIYDKLIPSLERRRENILNGKVNCIPSRFQRFMSDYVGIEQGKYTIITANTKIGKTQLANYLYVYNTLLYAYENPDKVRLKILYFNMEETDENITLRFISHLLYKYSQGKIRLSTKDLKSTRADKPLNESVLNLLKEEPYKSLLEFYEKVVEFRSERHPTGIMKAIESCCLENGTVHRKNVQILNKTTGQLETINAFDYYEPNDKDLYIIPIVDHMGLLTPEVGMSLKATMDLMSAYFVKLRNRYNISPVAVIQQAADTESTENFKLKKLRPTANGLGDSKAPARDCDLMLGLFSPFRHELSEYMGYNIQQFRNHIRFMEVIINREGDQNGICPLYFDGLTNEFRELPKPNDPEIQKYYNTVKQLNLLISKDKHKNFAIPFFRRWFF